MTQLTAAVTSCSLDSSQRDFTAHIDGESVGKEVSLYVRILGPGYKGAGDYLIQDILSPGSATLIAGLDHHSWGTGPSAGSLTINADEKSGKVDADLGSDEHVSGVFRCAKVIR
jgi:hypothetical protein